MSRNNVNRNRIYSSIFAGRMMFYQLFIMNDGREIFKFTVICIFHLDPSVIMFQFNRNVARTRVEKKKGIQLNVRLSGIVFISRKEITWISSISVFTLFIERFQKVTIVGSFIEKVNAFFMKRWGSLPIKIINLLETRCIRTFQPNFMFISFVCFYFIY